MITIAAGVCLGIVAAVIVLNWWQAHLVRREERREWRALKKAVAQQIREQAAWLQAYEDSLPPPPPPPLPLGPGALIVTFWVLSITAGLLAALLPY